MDKFRLEFDFGLILPFVQSHIHGFASTEGMTGIGLCRDDQLIAGVIFEGFNTKNIWMHVAAQPGAKWLVRSYLQACFHYPFITCGVDRISGYVNESNTAARKFDEHLGFHEEARLKGAAPDGKDVILYVMWRDDCRFIKEPNHGK